MTKFMDMNNDCIEYVLKCCNIDSIVAVSQTCKKLQSIGTKLFKNHNSYDCFIESEDDDKLLKRTLAQIGNHLTKLFVSVDINFRYYELCDSIFFMSRPDKFPNLRVLEVESEVEPNEFLCKIHTLKQIEHLTIHGINWPYARKVDISSIERLARESKQLKSFKIFGVQWDETGVLEFLREAENLQNFECQMEEKRFCLDTDFLQTFRSSEDQWTVLYQRLVELKIITDYQNGVYHFSDTDDISMPSSHASTPSHASTSTESSKSSED